MIHQSRTNVSAHTSAQRHVQQSGMIARNAAIRNPNQMTAIIAAIEARRSSHPAESQSEEVIKADPIDDAADYTGTHEFKLVWTKLGGESMMARVFDNGSGKELGSGIGDNEDDALLGVIDYLRPSHE
jgi:hypothetical protein